MAAQQEALLDKPATWRNDPKCGHGVACAYQTHYCTYIRVPKLLELQANPTPAHDELFLITCYQWHELWFRVLLADLRALRQDNGATFESIKLLRRGIALFELFDLHADLIETIVVRELALTKRLRSPRHSFFSDQLFQILSLARRLPHSDYPGFADVAREYVARLKSFRTRFAKLTKATLLPNSHASRPTYSNWLRLPELFDLQDGPRAAWTEPSSAPTALMKPDFINADENMFIIVHQCFELWFKVMLDQTDQAITRLRDGKILDATRLLRRVVQIQRLLNRQIEIPATMLPLDFLRFRSQKIEKDGKVLVTGLSPASGTESYQFRELEIVCGLREDAIFRHYLQGNDKLPIRHLTPRQAERLNQLSLADAFRQAVRQRGIENYDSLFTPANIQNPNTDLADLADTLIQLDEAFRFWRIGHVSMVEKMIGAKSGTGFLGPEYLMETAGIHVQEKNRIFEERQVRPRFFPELWAVRTRMGGQ